MMSEPDYDFLNEEAPDEVVPETVEPVAEVPAETVDTPPAAPVAQTPEVPTTPEPKEESVPLAALKAERAKRQELERRLAAVAPPERQPFYENPELHVEQVVSQRVFAMSEAQVKETYPDYEEVVQEFVEYANDKAYLQAEVNSHAHPALFAYKQGLALRERKELEDLPAYKARIESEIRSRLEKEFADKQASQAAAAAAVPPDISTSRAAKDTEVLPEDDLDSILASKKR